MRKLSVFLEMVELRLASEIIRVNWLLASKRLVEAGRYGFVLLIASLTCGSGPCSGAELTEVEATITDSTYTHADQLISISPSRRLNLHCTGSGSPTVIFDSGLGDSTKAWGLVQPEVSKHVRACSYDRAGLGFSDPSERPGTSANAVDDLHALLTAAHVAPPYVLVGHSSGGMNVQLYAETYRTDVVGIVYVDPTHEDLGQRLWDLEPGIDLKFKQWVETLQSCKKASPDDLASTSDVAKLCVFPDGPVYSQSIRDADLKMAYLSTYQQAWVSEMENVYFASADQLRAAKVSLGALPLVVLMKQPIAPQGTETQQLRDAKNSVWVALLDELAAQSDCGRRVVVNKTGHYIELDQPAAVTNAILLVVGSHGSCAHFNSTVLPQDETFK